MIICNQMPIQGFLLRVTIWICFVGYRYIFTVGPLTNDFHNKICTQIINIDCMGCKD